MAKCPGYATQTVEVALHEALQSLGNLRSLTEPGQRVILKHTLLQAQPSERAAMALATLVSAVCRWVRGAGAVPVTAHIPILLFSAQRLHRLCEAKCNAQECLKPMGRSCSKPLSGVLISPNCSSNLDRFSASARCSSLAFIGVMITRA